MLDDIRELLRKYSPSELDEHFLVACPFYKAESEYAPVYKLIHDLATSRVLVRLQLKLNEIAVASEFSLEFGRVNGVTGNKITVANGDNFIAFIEVKTGRLKLIQPAIYTYFEGVKTLVADLRMGDVLAIDVKTAERLIKELIRHNSDKEQVRELGKRIPGGECAYCGSDCELRLNKKRNYNPLKSLPKILENIEVVVEKILSEVTREVEKCKL